MEAINKVINWSHQSMRTRFKINVGVAYGSNVDLVASDIRKIINRKFIENNITIPFPQVDVHMKGLSTPYFRLN